MNTTKLNRLIAIAMNGTKSKDRNVARSCQHVVTLLNRARGKLQTGRESLACELISLAVRHVAFANTLLHR